MAKAATQKNTGAGAPPPKQEEQMAQGGTPPPPPPALADTSKAPDAPVTAGDGETEEASPSSVDGGAALVLPTGAKDVLVNALKGVHGRIGQIVLMLEQATEAEGVEMPSEPVVMIADAAGAIAMAVEPYLVKQAGMGMAPPPVGDAEVAKGEYVPWTQEYIDGLSDWCFLYVEPSTERDNDWRSLPLSNRKFPVRDHAGRLCLPMVTAAVGQLAAGAEPFISTQKKRKLMLTLACDRLSEATVAAYREEPMQPETAAELLAVAEMIAGIGQVGAPAPVVAPSVTDTTAAPTGEAASTPTVEQQMAALALKCGETIKSLVAMKSAPPATPAAPVAKADMGALTSVCAEMKALCQKMEGALGDETQMAAPPFPPSKDEAEKGAVVEQAKAAPVPPVDQAEALTKSIQVEVAKALAAQETEATGLRSELAKARALVTKAQAELAVKKTELTKAQRAVPPSNVDREEAKTVAKADARSGSRYITDLNQEFAKEAETSAS